VRSIAAAPARRRPPTPTNPPPTKRVRTLRTRASTSPQPHPPSLTTGARQDAIRRPSTLLRTANPAKLEGRPALKLPPIASVRPSAIALTHVGPNERIDGENDLRTVPRLVSRAVTHAILRPLGATIWSA